MDEDLRPWVDELWKYADAKPSVSGRQVTLRVKDTATSISLGSAPTGAVLTLEELGPGLTTVQLKVGPKPPESLEIHPSRQFDGELVLVETPRPLKRVVFLPGAPDGYQLSGLRAEAVEIRGAVRLTNVGHTLPTLELQDAELEVINRTLSVQDLHLSGNVRISGHGLTADKTSFRPAVSLRAPGECVLRRVRSHSDEQSLAFAVAEGTVQIEGAPKRTRMELQGASISLQRRPNYEFVSPEFTGNGTVIANALLQRPRFTEQGGVLVLHLAGQAREASGSIAVRADAGSVLSGDPKDPLRIKQVLDVTGAEIESVDLYGLSIADLAALAQTERLSPWIPSKRRDARQREDSMTLGGGQSDVLRRKRAHFWSRLAVILRDKACPWLCAVRGQVRGEASSAHGGAVGQGEGASLCLRCVGVR